MGQREPRLLIFDDIPGQYYLNITTETAKNVGWRPMPFTEADLAAEEFDERINALITRLPNKAEILIAEQEFPASGLIVRSNELNVPRAMLTNSHEARRFVRDNSSDVLIPSNVGIQHKIAGWLLHLSQTTV